MYNKICAVILLMISVPNLLCFKALFNFGRKEVNALYTPSISKIKNKINTKKFTQISLHNFYHVGPITISISN